jgi:hypothetical protein
MSTITTPSIRFISSRYCFVVINRHTLRTFEVLFHSDIHHPLLSLNIPRQVSDFYGSLDDTGRSRNPDGATTGSSGAIDRRHSVAMPLALASDAGMGCQLLGLMLWTKGSASHLSHSSQFSSQQFAQSSQKYPSPSISHLYRLTAKIAFNIHTTFDAF